METYLSEPMTRSSSKDEEIDMDLLRQFRQFAETDLQQVADIVGDSSVNRFSMDDGEIKISLTRKKIPFFCQSQQFIEKETVSEEMPHTLKSVTSRYLGILNLKSKTGDPLVKTGDYVKKGQVLATVDTLNIRNEIKTDRSGVVVEIFEENGKPVEYGQILFLVDTALPLNNDGQ